MAGLALKGWEPLLRRGLSEVGVNSVVLIPRHHLRLVACTSLLIERSHLFLEHAGTDCKISGKIAFSASVCKVRSGDLRMLFNMQVALQGVGHYCHLPSRRPFLQPSRLSTGRRNSFTRHFTAAAAEGQSDASKNVDVRKIGSIPFTQDNESFQQVMAFDGPAPEVELQLFPLDLCLESFATPLCCLETMKGLHLTKPAQILFVCFRG